MDTHNMTTEQLEEMEKLEVGETLFRIQVELEMRFYDSLDTTTLFSDDWVNKT